jgi:hypothetical protein
VFDVSQSTKYNQMRLGNTVIQSLNIDHGPWLGEHQIGTETRPAIMIGYLDGARPIKQGIECTINGLARPDIRAYGGKGTREQLIHTLWLDLWLPQDIDSAALNEVPLLESMDEPLVQLQRAFREEREIQNWRMVGRTQRTDETLERVVFEVRSLIYGC